MRLAQQAACTEQVLDRQFRAVEQPQACVVTVDAVCFELLQTKHQALTQRTVQAGSGGQPRDRNGLNNGHDVQLQGDGAEHLGQGLGAVDTNALILQRCRQIGEIRAGSSEALRPQTSGVVVLHQQSQWLPGFENQYGVLLVGLQCDAVMQPKPQMHLQQQVEIVVEPVLQ